MTLKALLASAESAFGARVSELERSRQRDYTEGSSGLRANHVSASVSALTCHDYIGNSMSHAVPFIQRSFECGCESWQCKGVSLAIYAVLMIVW